MPQSVMAIYEHGLLRPLGSLVLNEKQRVRIHVEPEKQIETVEHVFQFLTDMGWLTPPSGQPRVEPVSLKERRRVADILGKAAKKPVSEMVIEDRGEW